MTTTNSEINESTNYLNNLKEKNQMKPCEELKILQNAIDTDMRFEFYKGVLTFGTIADNYWGGHCAVYDRSAKFILKDVVNIDEFSLVKVGFDDYMQITLNGHLIYIGPDGGTKLEVRDLEGGRFGGRKQVFNGYNYHSCERDTNWHKELSIDLKPYLQEEENILNMRAIVSGNGEGWLQIVAKQNCFAEETAQLTGETCDHS